MQISQKKTKTKNLFPLICIVESGKKPTAEDRFYFAIQTSST